MSQAIPFKISKFKDKALLIQTEKGPSFYSHLHYHPEIQITAIHQSEGIVYAGNGMGTFKETDVFIIGPNVPHLFKNTEVYYTAESPGIHGTSIFFDNNSLGIGFFDLEETAGLRQLLHQSGRVGKILSNTREEINDKILRCKSLDKEDLILNFLEILSMISDSEMEFLNEDHYNFQMNEKEGDRLSSVLDYTFNHYRDDITIEHIASHAFLSRSQFSYFFKLHTGKSYIQFLNDIRIEQACVLLQDNQSTIEHICYEVGFKNISNFIRQFKRVKGMTPSSFRKMWTLNSI